MATITHNRVAGSAANPNVLVDGPAWDEGHVLSGQVGLSNGGTNADLSATGGTGQVLKQVTAGAAVTVGTVAASEIASPAALTKTDDTNVTLTLGGAPTTALLAATSITVGWTGTLASGRLNANVVQAITNDTNVTGSIAAQNLTLAWSGTLASGRLNSNVVQSVVNGTNVTGSIAAQALTLGWTGTLAASRGGFGADISAQSGVPLFATGTATFTSTSGTGNFVRVASPALTGSPTAPTQPAADNSTKIATTAYVDAADALKANLASPTFTGTPAAPTASVGTNTTQIATTAFVLANAGSSTLTSFSANKNSVDQTGVASATWTKVTYGTASWNDSTLYDTTNSKWTPPSGKVRLTAAVYISVGAVDQAQSLLAIYKNGSAFRYISITDSSGASGFVMNGSCIDSANGTDYYEVYVNSGGAGSKTILGLALYTWFVGETL